MNEYLKLLIIQYADKVKARSEIEVYSQEFQTIYNVLLSLNREFDLDFARGKQLDILGKIVGQSRNIPFVVAKTYFGFEQNNDSCGFGDAINSVAGCPLYDLREASYRDLELNDINYRFFIRARIAQNYTKSKMGGDMNIQDTIDYLFLSKAYIVDNKNMTITLCFLTEYFVNLTNIIKANLLPKPQGISYNFLGIQKLNFGFNTNNDACGFGDANTPTNGGFVKFYII